MKFAILGAGALGTILGAHLSRAGHEVVMIARGDRARVLQRQGLVLNGLSDIKARPSRHRRSAQAPRHRHADHRHQGHRLREELDTLEHLKSRMPSRCRTACSRTNCWRGVFGYSRVLGAMADFSGELLANGEVKFTRNVCLHLGEEKAA